MSSIHNKKDIFQNFKKEKKSKCSKIKGRKKEKKPDHYLLGLNGS
jgi:hypothetical protein